MHFITWVYSHLKIAFLVIILQYFSLNCFTQSDTLQHYSKGIPDKYGIVLIPSRSNHIYGLAIGLIGSEVICNVHNIRHSHGVNVQITGQGLFQTFIIGKPLFRPIISEYRQTGKLPDMDSLSFRTVHNGVLISGFGTFNSITNGIAVSPWISTGNLMNGIACNLLWNNYFEMNGLSLGIWNTSIQLSGIQLGLINKAIKMKGFQIGLWNRNEKRALPIINWNFTNKQKFRSL